MTSRSCFDIYASPYIYKRIMNEELNIFLKEIEQYTYAEKYRRWQDYLQIEAQSQNYLVLLGFFLESFPFNYKYWLQFIELTKFQEYQIALTRNPKSYELWTTYLHNCKLMYLENDQPKYKKQLEKCILEVGADSRALFMYEEYYQMVSQSVRFQFYKKLFTRALIGLEKMFEKFQIWFQTLSEAQINALAVKQFKNAVNTLSPEDQRNHLREIISAIYSKTISYRDRRLKLQSQIKHLYFDGSDYISRQKQIWRQLIQLQRQNGIVENISYCYQRSLMSQTDDVDLWQQVFHYMQNQTNKYTKVLSILRSNKVFFLKFDLSIYFYWCDLEERENVNTARKMYADLVKVHPTFEVYQRMIQLQIREKQWNNAKNMYDTVLAAYQNDVDMMSYILIDYSEFIVKHYKDFDYAKKFLKTYFDILPFNQYLFTKYLDFMKNFQNKEGFYEQLMLFINQALVKAKKTLTDQQFTSLTKIIKFYLRSALGSIYLIKISEHKMLEVEEKMTKTSV